MHLTFDTGRIKRLASRVSAYFIGDWMGTRTVLESVKKMEFPAPSGIKP